MIGTDRKSIISQGILYPWAITVDAINSKIYWVDHERDTIETASFEGHQRRVVMRNSHTSFYDIVLYKVGYFSIKEATDQVFICTVLSALTVFAVVRDSLMRDDCIPPNITSRRVLS